jgi:hypothetical protein
LTPTLPIIETVQIRTAILPENDQSLILNSENRSEQKEAFAELCLWVKALSCFVNSENPGFVGSEWKSVAAHNWKNELRAGRWALLRASHLTNQIFDFLTQNKNLDSAELSNLTAFFGEAVIAADALAVAPKLEFFAWKAWSDNLGRNLNDSEAFTKLLKIADQDVEREPMHQSFIKLVATEKPAAVELHETLKKIFALVERLNVIEKFLQTDKPLKPTLLLFVLIQHETRELLNYIENRVLRHLAPEHQYFDLLDSTIYIISLEIRKVYTRELTGVSAIRTAPLLFARIETAYGLLLDCLQQSVVVLAQAAVPNLENFQIFPNFKTKLEQSLFLRRELWRLLQTVQKAEREAASFDLKTLQEKAETFKREAMKFLMYKDCEPTERFVEEILHSRKTEEIAHLLHRFGAYLETLLGQVNMRTVLADHPFDYPQD